MFGQIDTATRLELQHLPHSGGIVALCGMPQAKVSYLVEAARQHVLEEAPHEFATAEVAGLMAARLAFSALDCDGLLVEAEDASIGEGNAKDITGEIVENSLFSGSPGRDVEYPRGSPCRVGDGEIRTFSAQHRS